MHEAQELKSIKLSSSGAEFNEITEATRLVFPPVGSIHFSCKHQHQPFEATVLGKDAHALEPLSLSVFYFFLIFILFWWKQIN